MTSVVATTVSTHPGHGRIRAEHELGVRVLHLRDDAAARFDTRVRDISAEVRYVSHLLDIVCFW